MARLNRDLVTIRETEAIDAFRAGKKVKEVNDALFNKYSRRMSPNRLYELYRQVKGDMVVSDAPLKNMEVAGLPAEATVADLPDLVPGVVLAENAVEEKISDLGVIKVVMCSDAVS